MEVTAAAPSPLRDMYTTTNMTYGGHYHVAGATPSSLLNVHHNSAQQLPPPPASAVTQRTSQQKEDYRVFYPGCIGLDQSNGQMLGIMPQSNLPVNTRGEYTNLRHHYFCDNQGVWSNANFNTPGATVQNGGVGTYSNLQGAWARVGPNTYDTLHGHGDWTKHWGVRSLEPASIRALYDHRNDNPADDWVPLESFPQTLKY